MIIAADSLHIEKFKEVFKGDRIIETPDIIEFYSTREPEIKNTTINWRIYSLVKKGVIKRVGRGRFEIGTNRIYSPVITKKLVTLYSAIRKEFPYINLCIWSTSVLNEFMIHQPGRFYSLVEVEKEVTQSVFYFLKEKRYAVFLEPTRDIIEKYVNYEEETIIVKPLVTEAPLQNLGSVIVPTLEKMLVDIYIDDLIFTAQQGVEMRTIFLEAMSKYSVNKNRMLRYAQRQGKRNSLEEYLNSTSILRH